MCGDSCGVMVPGMAGLGRVGVVGVGLATSAYVLAGLAIRGSEWLQECSPVGGLGQGWLVCPPVE